MRAQIAVEGIPESGSRSLTNRQENDLERSPAIHVRCDEYGTWKFTIQEAGDVAEIVLANPVVVRGPQGVDAEDAIVPVDSVSCSGNAIETDSWKYAPTGALVVFSTAVTVLGKNGFVDINTRKASAKPMGEFQFYACDWRFVVHRLESSLEFRVLV